MRVANLVGLGLLSALLGCSGQQTTIGSSVGEKRQVEEAPPEALAFGGGGGAAPAASAGGSAGGAPASAPLSEEPAAAAPPDPALVKALVDKTGEAATDNPLHLRLEINPGLAGELWLLGVVNRGTEVAKVRFDLRRLTLTLTPPEPTTKPPAWKPKPKPIVCKLPESFAGLSDSDEPQLLAPGEGLVQTFDPRLYCISPSGDSLLATGQRIIAKLGFAPKPPRVVWKKGGRAEVPVLQAAPFVAEPAALEPSQTIDAEHDPRVKQLVASEIALSAEMTNKEAEDDPSLPLQLRLLHGSDAATELGATVALDVKARKKSGLYFRRELVSFVVHGPDGIRGCNPQPDDRSPDRQAYLTLAPGQSVNATSLLAELCPKYTFGRPGLYVVSARMDADRDGSEFGLSAFTGRLESRKEALIRIKTGELKALPPPEPLRVKVGQ